jgi:hypothetical protein
VGLQTLARLRLRCRRPPGPAGRRPQAQPLAQSRRAAGVAWAKAWHSPAIESSGAAPPPPHCREVIETLELMAGGLGYEQPLPGAPAPCYPADHPLHDIGRAIMEGGSCQVGAAGGGGRGRGGASLGGSVPRARLGRGSQVPGLCEGMGREAVQGGQVGRMDHELRRPAACALRAAVLGGLQLLRLLGWSLELRAAAMGGSDAVWWRCR